MRKVAVCTAAGMLMLSGLASAQEKRYRSAWELVADQHDRDRDGRVTAEEYGRGEERFGRLDRNGDGVLTEVDFEAGRRGPARRDMRGFGLARLLRIPPRGSLARAELEDWLKERDRDGDGILTEKELAGQGLGGRRLFVAMRALDADRDGDLSKVEVEQAFAAADKDGNGTVTGEEIGDRPGRPGPAREVRAPLEDGVPRPGQKAPDFTLPTKDGQKKVTLSSFAGKRPVALVFGSYT